MIRWTIYSVISFLVHEARKRVFVGFIPGNWPIIVVIVLSRDAVLSVLGLSQAHTGIDSCMTICQVMTWVMASHCGLPRI